MTAVPTLGRIVLYKLSDRDAFAINQRRFDAHRHMEQHRETANGVMIHVGNQVASGQEVPAIIVAVHGDTPDSAVNLRCLLDGTDTFWATSRLRGTQGGMWSWPVIAPVPMHSQN